jgi:hypothetical protein
MAIHLHNDSLLFQASGAEFLAADEASLALLLQSAHVNGDLAPGKRSRRPSNQCFAFDFLL